MAAEKPSLLVLTSTYPRWLGDTEPSFVHQLNTNLRDALDITVLAPHFRGAALSEEMDGIHVIRFRYQFPVLETLVNDGGILSNLKANPLKWFLVPFFFLFQAIAIIRCVRRLEPDVMHIHWIIPQGLSLLVASWFVRLPPGLLTSHGGDLFSFRSGILSGMKRAVLKKMKRVSIVSSAMRQAAISLGVDAGNVVVAPMGVDFASCFTADATAGQEKKIVFVGRLVEKKGLEYLIDILLDVVSVHPDLQLHIIGNGPLYESLQQQVIRQGLHKVVLFKGALPQAEVAEALRTASIFVAPFVQAASGDQEGLGLVTLEAMGMGVPVLVGDVPAVHDIGELQPDEIIDPVDGNALRKALLDRLDDLKPYRASALARSSHVQEKWGWPAAAGRYRSLILDLARLPALDSEQKSGP